jgi:hypothetical protein
VASTEEALAVIWPFFLRRPAVFERSAGIYLKNLRENLAALGRQPPPSLLAREATFAALRSSSTPTAG